MTQVFIAAWSEHGADEVIKFFEDGDELFRSHMVDWGHVHPTREAAEKKAREYMASDTIDWPIYVYEREVSWDPFAAL